MGPVFKPGCVGVENFGGEWFKDEVFVVFENRSSASNELWEKQSWLAETRD